MPTLFTIGYTQKKLEAFVHLLQEAGVDAVIDIRLRNTSQLAGFAKRDDLAFLLRTCIGIDYQHRPELAPTAEILDAYKSSRDWLDYEGSYLPLLIDRGAETVGRELLTQYSRPCLLCAEPTPEHCHRRLVAEWWAERMLDLEIKHLS